MAKTQHIVSGIIVFFAISWVTGILRTTLSCLLIILFGVFGFVLGVISVVRSGKRYFPRNPPSSTVAHVFIKEMMGIRQRFQPCQRKIVTTRNLDTAIQEVIDLTITDYVISWYQEIGTEKDRFSHLIQDEIWEVISNLSERLTKVDRVNCITEGVVTTWTNHFSNIRIASTRSPAEQTRPIFHLHPWLASQEREIEFLRKVAEVLEYYLFPKHYANCNISRHLLREILACKVLYPAVALFSDPDYINQKLYTWLQYREQLYDHHRRTYTYAATYEDFMKIIEKCQDIEHLKQIRYSIISEIMQATTIQNLKRAKGLDTDKESAPKSNTKGDLLKARNLKRYINQLRVTKAACEKRIYVLGGPDYKSYTEDHQDREQNISGKKVLSFSVVMETPEAREHLLKYLLRTQEDALLRFWISVEGMKHSDKRHWHQTASEIYQMFISHPSGVVRNRLDRTTIRGMESFMIGDKVTRQKYCGPFYPIRCLIWGAESFYQAQEQIAHALEEKHYPSFILSEVYHKYIRDRETEDVTSTQQSNSDQMKEKQAVSSSENKEIGETAMIVEHSTYAQAKLLHLDEKIVNKTRALQALMHSQKPDNKMLKLQEDIGREIEDLRIARRQLEFHIERTDLWVDYVGKWRAQICSEQILEQDNKLVPYFNILVNIPGVGLPRLVPGSSDGWIVTRKLDDFHALHDKMVEINHSLKIMELPRVGKFRRKSLDAAFLKKAGEQLNKYLTVVLQVDQLAQSEAVFAFFSPSPEHLKHPEQLQKTKGRFSFANLLKSLPAKGDQDSDCDNDLLFGDPGTVHQEIRKDSIAEPLYQLIGEIFQLQGVFKWLRRTLMVFVQVSFGRSINRQLRETVEWIFSEPMLIYYIRQFRDSFWPNGHQAPVAPPRSDEDKLRTRMLAKEKFLQNIPDAVKNLVGDQNARRGALKVFESFQDSRLNKHLFYELLELFLYEAIPELNNYRRQGETLESIDMKPSTIWPISSTPEDD